MKNVFLPLILISLIAIPTLGYANTHNKPEAFSRKVIGSVNDWLSRLVIGSVNDGKDGVEKGDARQLYRLGLIYAEAHGFPKYSKEGIRLIQKYAEKGYAPAQFDLAHVYAEGRDVPQDLVTALMWSNLFMSQREPYGMGFQETIVAKMTPVQIVKAQKLTREWTRKHGLRAINRGIDFKRALETYLAPNENTGIDVMTLKRSFPGCHFNNIDNIKNPEKVYTQYSLVFQGKCLLINKGVPIASQSIDDDGDAVVTITTDGDRAGIASTTFSTVSSNSLFDVIFNQTGWETDLVRCDVVWSATFWTRIYSLKIPNAKPVFAIVTYYQGGNIENGELTIYLGQDLPDVGSKETFRGYYPNINWTDCDTSQGDNPDTSQEEKAENDKPNSTRTVLGDNQELAEGCPTGTIENMITATCEPESAINEPESSIKTQKVTEQGKSDAKLPAQENACPAGSIDIYGDCWVGENKGSPEEIQTCKNTFKDADLYIAKKMKNTLTCWIKVGYEDILFIIFDNEVVFEITDYRIIPWDWKGDLRVTSIPDPIDIGDGEKYLVVKTWGGGSHCCARLFIFDLENPKRKIDVGQASKERNNPPELKNLDSDSFLEIELLDESFVYWKTGFAGSPFPRVILDFKDGTFLFSPELMKRPPFDPIALKEAVKKIRLVSDAHNEWIKSVGPQGIKFFGTLYRNISSEVWGTMLELIYTGNADQAYEFLAMIPNIDASDMKRFKCEFAARLSTSPFWKGIRSMNPYFQTDEYQKQSNCDTSQGDNPDTSQG